MRDKFYSLWAGAVIICCMKVIAHAGNESLAVIALTLVFAVATGTVLAALVFAPIYFWAAYRRRKFL